MSPSDWELLVELLGGFGFLLVGLGVGLTALWILLPFAVFGIKGLLTEIVSELSEMNDQLSKLNGRRPRTLPALPTGEEEEPGETPDIPATFMGLKWSEMKALREISESTKPATGFRSLRLPRWYKRLVGRAPFDD